MVSHIDSNLPEVQKFVIALKFKSYWPCFHVHVTAFVRCALSYMILFPVLVNMH